MNQDSTFIKCAFRVTNLLIINVLFVLCCVPVFTAGASVTAMYCITFKMIRDEEPTSIVKGFFVAFKENFARSTLMWLLFVLCGAFLFIDLNIASSLSEGMLRSLLTGILVAAVVVYLFALSYVFVLASAFDARVKEHILNAIRLSLGKIQYTVPILILNLSPCLVLFVPISQLKWILLALLFIWFSAVAYLNTFIFRRLFTVISENK